MFVFFYQNTRRTTTSYFNSVFFERSKAQDLLDYFKQGFDGMPFGKMIQVSMDGPNVNWSFLSKLEQELVVQLSEENVSWKVQQALTCGFWLFKESTLRKVEFKTITKSAVLPKKFCSTRWVENVEPAKTLLAIAPHLEQFLKEAKDSRKENLHSWKTLVAFLRRSFLQS